MATSDHAELQLVDSQRRNEELEAVIVQQAAQLADRSEQLADRSEQLADSARRIADGNGNGLYCGMAGTLADAVVIAVHADALYLCDERGRFRAPCARPDAEWASACVQARGAGGGAEEDQPHAHAMFAERARLTMCVERAFRNQTL